MLRALADFVIALLELLEAELRNLRQGAFRFVVSFMLVTVAGVLLLGSAGLLVAALYLYLITFMTAAAAALVSGAGILLIAGVVLWIARGVLRRR